MFHSFKLKPLLISIAISLAVGGIGAIVTNSAMDEFMALKKPSFTPPPIVFSIVWTILFLLMGISAYIAYKNGATKNSIAFKLYALQLFLNFFWTVFFFHFHWFLISFVWLIILLAFIICMIAKFNAYSKLAGYLQIPYCLWVCFAGYLNFCIYLLN